MGGGDVDFSLVVVVRYPTLSSHQILDTPNERIVGYSWEIPGDGVLYSYC